MILTVGGALLVGLFGIAFIKDFYPEQMASFDNSKPQAETIFIFVSRILFHPLIGGFLLSAILAAVMSTISSQLLVTSSSMTEDIYKAFINKKASPKNLLFTSRASVLIVAVVALILSLNPQDTILNLVGNAWAGFAAAFGPVVLLSLLWKRTTNLGALLGMIAGGITVLLWVYIPHEYKELYEIIPGFFLGFITIIIVSLLTPKPSKEIEEEFESVDQKVKKLDSL